ncbi:Casein kinase I hhp1 [Tritrichomonas foetus]|uniref:non-specific serine/threonine protein kinase n=1 Tax=Tritrichomonas foetus TaxID=1144522 RepID=A0A1J4L383_9EUKA|nr:Casein kinase I hhp1 [Tritrichomonas foetus]|eukprot:OHT16373.1 Casein kinase I hhp1 [Tritrichomonas foetus]
MHTNTILNNLYLVKEEIGHGGFGVIYLAENTLKRNKKMAVKYEDITSINEHLKNEYEMYGKLCGISGIPKVEYFGHTALHNVLVMELLGKSLNDLLLEVPNKKFSLKTGLMIFDQMLSLVQICHENGIIHRDIKPSNFLIGREENKSQLFIIDFGLAKSYVDKKTKIHIPYVEGKILTGAAKYVSINTHMGIEPSRRDDLESLGYVIVYLLKGSLPWSHLNGSNNSESISFRDEENDCIHNDDDNNTYHIIQNNTNSRSAIINEKILELKLSTSYDCLCDGLPVEFADYFRMIRNLGFSDEPPYAQIRGTFQKLFRRLKFVYDYKYDWVENGNAVSRTSINVHDKLLGGREFFGAEDTHALKTRRSLPLPQKTPSFKPRETLRKVVPKAVMQRRSRPKMTEDMVVTRMDK